MNISYPIEAHNKYFELEESSFWFSHRNNVIKEIIRLYNVSELYDVGGGNGYTVKAIQDIIPCTLIEPLKQGVKNAKQRGVKNTICSTLQDSELSKDLDTISLLDVVEHIADDNKFIQEVGEYCKRLIITVPAYSLLWSSEDVDAGHYRRYSMKQITDLVNNAGFKVKYKTCLFSVLVPAIFILRTIPSKLGIDIGDGSGDHKNNFIINKILNWELQRVKEKEKIIVGSSLFVYAEKAR